MLVSEVSAEDCKKAADLINGIRGLKLEGSTVVDAAKLVDGLRWLQDTAVKMAQAYSVGAAEKPAASAEPPKEGFAIKQHVPGTVGADQSGNRKRR
jgi:hypothetical protein